MGLGRDFERRLERIWASLIDGEPCPECGISPQKRREAIAVYYPERGEPEPETCSECGLPTVIRVVYEDAL